MDVLTLKNLRSAGVDALICIGSAFFVFPYFCNLVGAFHFPLLEARDECASVDGSGQ